MEFQKFVKMQNASSRKAIISLECMEVEPNEQYVVEEKLDGANFSVYISNKDGIRAARRTGFIEEGEKFYNYQAIMERYKPLFEYLQSVVNKTKNTELLVLTGELIGKKINGRVDYGDRNKFIVYNIRHDNGEYLTPQNRDIFMRVNRFPQEMFVPELKFLKGIEEVKKYISDIRNIEIESALTPVEHNHKDKNLIEGVVIKPFEYDSNNGARYIKFKNEKFSEKNKPTVLKEKIPALEKYIDIFHGYVNENRMLSIFSQEGTIQDEIEIGKYIQLILQDAKYDFLEDYENTMKEELNIKHIPMVYKRAGAKIAKMLKKQL